MSYQFSRIQVATQISCRTRVHRAILRIMTQGILAWSPLLARLVSICNYIEILFTKALAGAGKSTLIKMVIDLATEHEEGTFATPIVGSIQNPDIPTSGDVHLYSDPNSISTITPILYADCEGMGGGEREPVSSRFKKNKRRFAGVGRVSSFEKKARRTQHTSEKESAWADKPAKQSREFAVTHLYPRLLFTFSDVVVFVPKEARWVMPAIWTRNLYADIIQYH